MLVGIRGGTVSNERQRRKESQGIFMSNDHHELGWCLGGFEYSSLELQVGLKASPTFPPLPPNWYLNKKCTALTNG